MVERADTDASAGAASAGDTETLPFPAIPPRQDNLVELLRVPCSVARVVVRGNKRTKVPCARRRGGMRAARGKRRRAEIPLTCADSRSAR